MCQQWQAKSYHCFQLLMCCTFPQPDLSECITQVKTSKTIKTSKTANIPAGTVVVFPLSFPLWQRGFLTGAFCETITLSLHLLSAKTHLFSLVSLFSLSLYTSPPCCCFGLLFSLSSSKAAIINVEKARWKQTAGTEAMKHQPSFLGAVFSRSLQ